MDVLGLAFWGFGEVSDLSFAVGADDAGAGIDGVVKVACVDVDASACAVDILEYLVDFRSVNRSELQGLA